MTGERLPARSWHQRSRYPIDLGHNFVLANAECNSATASRNVNLYQVWRDPATRPLVPISHLMTHGIIYRKSKYSKGDDTLRDFSNYVMMYYMRGLPDAVIGAH